MGCKTTYSLNCDVCSKFLMDEEGEANGESEKRKHILIEYDKVELIRIAQREGWRIDESNGQIRAICPECWGRDDNY